MNTTTSQFIGVLDEVPANPWMMLLSFATMVLALMVPVAAIAVCVAKSPTRKVSDDELGLGSVSLQDEMWHFVTAVERGEVTLASLTPADQMDPGADLDSAAASVDKRPPGGSRRIAG